MDHLGDRADGHPRQQRIGCLGALTQVFPPPPTTISGRFPARQRAQAPPPHSPFHLDAILGHFGAKVDQSGSFRLGALHPQTEGRDAGVGGPGALAFTPETQGDSKKALICILDKNTATCHTQVYTSGAKVDQSGSLRLGALHPKPRGATRESVAWVLWH